MTEIKTHWKKLHNPDYLGAYSLMDGEVKELTISFENVTTKQVKNIDGKDELCVIGSIKGNKPMILNSTNMKMMAKIAESPYVEDWEGISVTLYVSKVKAFGDLVDALRIKPYMAKVKPVLIYQSEPFKACLAAFQADKSVLAKIQAKYEIEADVLAKLTES